MTFQSNLAGATPNAYGFISPEEWYFTQVTGASIGSGAIAQARRSCCSG